MSNFHNTIWCRSMQYFVAKTLNKPVSKRKQLRDVHRHFWLQSCYKICCFFFVQPGWAQSLLSPAPCWPWHCSTQMQADMVKKDSEDAWMAGSVARFNKKWTSKKWSCYPLVNYSNLTEMWQAHIRHIDKKYLSQKLRMISICIVTIVNTELAFCLAPSPEPKSLCWLPTVPLTPPTTRANKRRPWRLQPSHQSRFFCCFFFAMSCLKCSMTTARWCILVSSNSMLVHHHGEPAKNGHQSTRPAENAKPIGRRPWNTCRTGNPENCLK